MDIQTILPSSVLLLDLGGTLEHGGVVLPDAAGALDVISGFRTSSGQRLPMALVSDFTMPAPGAGSDEIERLFRDHVDMLSHLGLASYFQPPEQRITLSTQAGVRKPHRAVFELALERLGVAPRLDACLFVTESAEHVGACRALGMHALRFGPDGDFDAWSAGPLILARVLGIRDAEALGSALDLRLHRRFGQRLLRVESIAESGDGGARISALVGDAPDSPTPVAADITLARSGDVAALAVDGSPVGARADADLYRRVLDDNARIAPAGADLPPGATHTLEPGPDGDMVLRRRRYSIL
ncbi:HAD family hydrolase [Sorangium sp. So ce1153]|uniref:HAD family hydrolase n=1 Tax=Sorangium sp. So ce1153 TaxID=3133333 RepID=UPI003F60B72D